jgi:pyrroloquinoline quinone (PQQ) biosynthesis protein C
VSADHSAYLNGLVSESLGHPAVQHPWLEGIARGSFPDPLWSLRDFAWHYSSYSAWFTRYLQTVIDRLGSGEHQRLLAQNLAEENGQLDDDERATLSSIGIDPATVANVPHRELFRRMCRALGVDQAQLAVPAGAALLWRSRLLGFLRQATAAEAVGALGLGTEGIVKHIYRPMLEGMRKYSGLQRSDYVFLELHCHVDDHHQQDLLDIANDLAATAKGRADLRRGMLTALDLRRAFWDHLYRRAVRGPQVASA